MTAPNTVPCGQLPTPALVARVASCMDLEGIVQQPPFAMIAGRCRFCGHALPYAYSATAYINGEVKRAEWNEGEPMGEKLKLNAARPLTLGNGVALVHLEDSQVWETHEGLRPLGQMIPEVLLSPNAACAALTDDVFRQATTIVRTKGENIRKALQVKQRAGTIIDMKEARDLARKLAAKTIKS